MTENEFKEYQELSSSMYSAVCDSDSLVSINIEAQTNDAIIKQFIATKASKSDFEVLVGLMEFWNRSTSTITLESYDVFKAVTGSNVINANLSRSIKSLENCEFIQKLTNSRKLEFFFEIPYEILRNEHMRYIKNKSHIS